MGLRTMLGLKKKKQNPLFFDFEDLHKSIFDKVKPYTLTTAERIYGLIEAVKYISKHSIEGDIIECGVWKGGSMMAIAETLISCNDLNRQLYLYDTFEGMTAPTEADENYLGENASQLLKTSSKEKHPEGIWAYSPLQDVQNVMQSTGYNQNKIQYIKGKVEDTIPKTLPNKIALLRLDTDWYESTKHELIHLFPLLASGGVLIIDDYGCWKGSRKATDEYFSENNIRILLNRMDEGRIAIKQ